VEWPDSATLLSNDPDTNPYSMMDILNYAYTMTEVLNDYD